MKTAVLHEWKKFTMEEGPIPTPASDEVVIRVAYTGICGSDVHSFEGKHPTAQLPLVVGHEFSGYIESTGSGVTGLSHGDRVCAHIIRSCGVCEACIAGHANLCRNLKVMGTQIPGCFAEYVAVPASKVYKLRPDADLRMFALAEPLAVGSYATMESGMTLGKSAFVIGGGPIGICCGLSARMAGATDVVFSEVSPQRIEFLKSFGFRVMNPLEGDAQQTAMELSGGRGYDVVYETSGVPAGSELVARVGAVRSTGMMVAITNKPQPIDTWAMIRNEMRLKTIRVHQQPAYAAAVRMIESGVINEDLKKLITHEFSFEQLQEAFDFSVADATHCKVMIDFHADEA